mmetsp:Transcript_23301/g.42128  ORF Transcript_23301/g.42128 Transcript_23301/m.42128 type:complete len:82 (+) Transcript_23301:1063-1308(+)
MIPTRILSMSFWTRIWNPKYQAKQISWYMPGKAAMSSYATFDRQQKKRAPENELRSVIRCPKRTRAAPAKQVKISAKARKK